MPSKHIPTREEINAAVVAASEVMFTDDYSETRGLMSEIAHDLMGDAQLFPVLHPTLLAVMFALAAELFPEVAGEHFEYVHRARSAADDPEQSEEVRREWRREHERLSDELEALRPRCGRYEWDGDAAAVAEYAPPERKEI